MSEDSQEKLAKNVTSVELAQQEQDKRKSTSSQRIADRACQRAEAYHRGEGVHVTRSTSKQLGALKDKNESLTTNMPQTTRTPNPKTKGPGANAQDTETTGTGTVTGGTTRAPDPKVTGPGAKAGGKKSEKTVIRRARSDESSNQSEDDREQQLKRYV